MNCAREITITNDDLSKPWSWINVLCNNETTEITSLFYNIPRACVRTDNRYCNSFALFACVKYNLFVRTRNDNTITDRYKKGFRFKVCN